MFAALDKLRASGANKKFAADVYAGVYTDMRETLDYLASEDSTKDDYHPLMAKIFRLSE